MGWVGMRRIGIQMDFAGGYGRSVLKGIMHFAQFRSDWEFAMPPMYRTSRRRPMVPRQLDGMIAMLHDERSAQPFRQRRVPLVNTARTLSLARLRAARVPSVLPDDEAVGRLAYRYFRDRGFASFAFCGHPTGDWSLVRQHAFEQAARADGFPCEVSVGADEVPARWVAALPRATALFAANDRYSWYAVAACRAAGRRIPDEVAVLGVDNDELTVAMARPTLSSIELPGFQIGQAAAALLVTLMEGGQVSPAPQLFAPEAAISRASTDVLAMDDEAVVGAIRFIRASADKPITVDDVLGVVPLGRRSLERRFRGALGRSLLDEIRKSHIELAKRLLRETAMDMPVIARRSGFTSAVRFSTVFHDVVGMPPTAFRRQHQK
jgi:LacI family transcriptional regulator